MSPPTGGRAWYVAPNGTPRGSGRLAAPWSLAHVAKHPPKVGPGDTIWMKGGMYPPPGDVTLQGGHDPARPDDPAGCQPITLRAMPGERVTIDPGLGVTSDAGGQYAFRFFGGHIVLRDVEIANQTVPGGNRCCSSSRQTVPPGFHPAIAIYQVPDVKIINSIIRNVAEGIDVAQLAYRAELYGNIFTGIGFQDASTPVRDPLRFTGYASYAKPIGGTFEQNVVANGYSYGLHLFNTTAAGAPDMTVRDHVSINSQDLAGGDSGMLKMRVERVLTWRSGFAVGYHADGCSGVSITGSIFESGLTPAYQEPCQTQMAPRTTGNYIGPTWDCACPRTKFSNNTHAPSPVPDQTVVMPNRYEPGRALAVIYNTQAKKPTVTFVVPGLPIGTPYRVVAATHFYGPTVTRGTYAGTITVPMANVPVETPQGGYPWPVQGGGPEFAAFVVLPEPLHVTPTPLSDAHSANAIRMAARSISPRSPVWHPPSSDGSFP